MAKGKKGKKSKPAGATAKLVRTDTHLPADVAAKIEAKGATFNHSRKSYIEWLCMKDVENFEMPSA